MGHEKDQERPVMGDLMDSQLETSDGVMIGRVADIEAEWCDDGRLVMTNIVTGPQALLCRINPRLRSLARFIFRNRFEHKIPMSEIEKVGATIRLRGKAEDYAVGQSDRWIAAHILRWIPGSR